MTITQHVEVAPKAEVIEVATPQTRDAEQSLAFIKDYKITTGGDFAGAVGMVAQIKGKWGEVDAKRKKYVDRLAALVDDFNGEFKPGLEALKHAEKLLKDKLAGWAQDQAQKREAKIREASAAAEGGDPVHAEELIAEAEQFEVPKVKGCSIREVWSGEVMDASQIPAEYRTPDEKQLKAITKARKCDPGIPGWRAYPQPAVTITVSRVRT